MGIENRGGPSGAENWKAPIEDKKSGKPETESKSEAIERLWAKSHELSLERGKIFPEVEAAAKNIFELKGTVESGNLMEELEELLKNEGVEKFFEDMVGEGRSPTLEKKKTLLDRTSGLVDRFRTRNFRKFLNSEPVNRLIDLDDRWDEVTKQLENLQVFSRSDEPVNTQQSGLGKKMN